jgi:hypothetical protein
MKTALKFLALLLAAYAFVGWNDARADVVAQSPNKSDGSIILFDRQGVCPKGQHTVIARAKDGTSIIGCWYYADGFVVVKWSDGDLRTYSADSFVPAKAKGTAL